MGFFVFFFRIDVNLLYIAIKDIFFSVCLFFLLTITGRNVALYRPAARCARIGRCNTRQLEMKPSL